MLPRPFRNPLAIDLDLDGDGVETIGITPAGTPILFDHDADGSRTGTGWLKPDDGWLVRDVNGNGTIDGGRELFGIDTGIAPADVALRRLYDGGYESLELSIAGTSDKITARYAFYWDDPTNPYNPVQQIKFADGTTWDPAAIKAKVFEGTVGSDSIVGTNAADVIFGQAGADTLYGRDGNDVLNGGADNDTLHGENGNDTLDGGAGNDTLYGGAGNDVYLFGPGSGADLLNDYDYTAGNTDVLSVGAGVAADQIWLRRIGSDLEVSIIGTGDKTTIANWYSGSAYHVEQLKIADGKVLLDSQVDALVSAMAAFAPPAAGQTTLPAGYQSALNPVIAASWH